MGSRASSRAAYVVEHPRVEFISYPYEWPFRALKAAALHHLDLQLDLLAKDAVLSDAPPIMSSSRGPKPVFIDLLSVRPYREGEFWIGHRQFCEQFLNPLLLQSKLGIAFNTWYRGNLEGIPTADLARALPLSSRFSWNMLSQVILQAKLQAKATDAPAQAIQDAKKSRPCRGPPMRAFCASCETGSPAWSRRIPARRFGAITRRTTPIAARKRRRSAGSWPSSPPRRARRS